MDASNDSVRSVITDDLCALAQLVRRALKVFLKDKMSVFLSLLAPLIVFMLYILFLGDIQTDAVMSSFPDGVELSEKSVKAFVDSWMIAGVLGVACITVSLTSNNIMVQDKCRGVINDFVASPVKKWVVTAGYFLFNYVVTAAICSVVYVVCLVYLAAAGEFFMSAADVFAVFGVLLFAALSSTLITVFIASLLRTESALAGMSGILSAAIGFLIGAYMPLSAFPTGIQYFSALLPGTHAAALFRGFLMDGALQNFTNGMPAAVGDYLSDYFSIKLNFFGAEAGADIMAIYVACSVLIFAAVNLAAGTRLLNIRRKGRPAVSGVKTDKRG